MRHRIAAVLTGSAFMAYLLANRGSSSNERKISLAIVDVTSVGDDKWKEPAMFARLKMVKLTELNEDDLFEAYKTKFQKSYEAGEEEHRRVTFRSNLRLIDELNAQNPHAV